MNKDWIYSQKAKKIFHFSAWWSLLVTVIVVALYFHPSFQDNLSPSLRVGTSVLIAVSGIVGSLAIMILIVGMLLDLTTSKEHRIGFKLIWTAFMFFTAPVGVAIYFFTVYRRSAKMKG